MAGSALLIDEFFANEDARFLDEVFASTSEKKLQALGARWASDPRPFARDALFAYIDDGCDRPHQRVLVKKLFKELEQKGDDEAMGHFLVAFDRLVRRKMVTLRGWDYQARAQTMTTALRMPRKKVEYVTREVQREAINPLTRQKSTIKTTVREPVQAQQVTFSTATRSYLKRRAFRYFRKLGYADVARYGRAIRGALALYEDQHLAAPEQLLDAWGFVNALYWSSDVLDRRARGIVVAAGRSLAELAAAPMFPEAWRACFADVLMLARSARSRPVRVFALGLLDRDYQGELRKLPIADVIALIRSREPELAALGSKLLPNVAGLDNLPVRDWLELLRLEDPIAISTVCELALAKLRPDRVTLAQAVDLACARPTPVAELGLRWAKDKPNGSAEALAELGRLTRAENPKVRAEGVRFYVEVLERSPSATHERVRDLFDAGDKLVRAEGIAVLGRSERFRDDTALWAALSETPYPDVRAFLVRHLDVRQKVLLADERRRLWASTLLAVLRGSREKRLAVTQIAERLVKSPADMPALVPLLALALRSVRETERRAALAAIARAAFRSPELRRELGAAVPELALGALEIA